MYGIWERKEVMVCPVWLHKSHSPIWRTQSNTSIAVCKALLKTSNNSNNNNKNLMVTYSCLKKNLREAPNRDLVLNFIIYNVIVMIKQQVKHCYHFR